MDVFDVNEEQRFDPARHVERILEQWPGGDVSLACWEPGQISPDHCHPNATEIYFCFTGGGQMRTPDLEVTISPRLIRCSSAGRGARICQWAGAHAAVPRPYR